VKIGLGHSRKKEMTMPSPRTVKRPKQGHSRDAAE
jgi:hypothetical protein